MVWQHPQWEMLCIWECPLGGSRDLLALKRADSVLFEYVMRKAGGGFLGHWWCDIPVFFGMWVPGSNKHPGRQKAATGRCERVASCRRVSVLFSNCPLMWVLWVIALSTVTPRGDEAVVCLWTWMGKERAVLLWLSCCRHSPTGANIPLRGNFSLD